MFNRVYTNDEATFQTLFLISLGLEIMMKFNNRSLCHRFVT